MMTADMVRDRRQVGWFLFGVFFAGFGCLVYWGNGNYLAVDPPVEDPNVAQRLQLLGGEAEGLKIKLIAERTRRQQLEAMIKTQNVLLQQREQQLRDLQVSVPTQPIVLREIQKEAATAAGLQKIIARNFGSEIASRIQVKE